MNDPNSELLKVSAKEAHERGLSWREWQAANGLSTPRLERAYCAVAGHKWGLSSDWYTGIQRCKRCGHLMGSKSE